MRIPEEGDEGPQVTILPSWGRGVGSQAAFRR
jgi:hypothetical protein